MTSGKNTIGKQVLLMPWRKEKKTNIQQIYPTGTQKLSLLALLYVHNYHIFSHMTIALISFYPSSQGESNFTQFGPLSK